MSYKDKLKDSIYWWLNRSKPFYVNEDYKIELLFIDINNLSAKIRVTNLKTGLVTDTASEIKDEQSE